MTQPKSTGWKPPTKAQKRAEMKALVSKYGELMFIDSHEIDRLGAEECQRRTDRAYRLAARIVEIGIETGLYR